MDLLDDINIDNQTYKKYLILFKRYLLVAVVLGAIPTVIMNSYSTRRFRILDIRPLHF
jgi:hypothetical protein